MAVGVEWREIPGFPGYFACSDGSVWSRLSGDRRRLRPAVDRDGYWMYQLKSPSGTMRTVKGHHLVLAAFGSPRPPGAVTRHLNGKRDDNRPGNLAWGSMRENAADREAHGNQHHGERNVKALLTEEAVREILATPMHRGMRPSPYRLLAEKYGVSIRAIGHVRSRTAWKHVEA